MWLYSILVAVWIDMCTGYAEVKLSGFYPVDLQRSDEDWLLCDHCVIASLPTLP